MDVSTRSETTVTCYIELSPDERFVYKRSRFSRARLVTRLELRWDYFKMFERDKNGTLWSISRDGIKENVHFWLNDAVPGMPEHVRREVEKNLGELQDEHLERYFQENPIR